MRTAIAFLLLTGCALDRPIVGDCDVDMVIAVDAGAPCGHQGEECCDPFGNPASDRSQLVVDAGGAQHVACFGNLACNVAVGTQCLPPL
jgi:hypothetical protein